MAFRPVWRRAILVAAVLGVSACSNPATAEAPTQEPAFQLGAQVGNPEHMEIPKIGVDVPLVALGLTADNKVEVPPVDQPLVTGWFEPGPEPGEPGKALILAHVNGRDAQHHSVPGTFARLHELAVTDQIIVDGRIFAVTNVQRFPKDKFPAEVFEHADDEQLRLVTCGGDFDPVTRNYKDNWVVSAKAI